jgi:hypothetical protein
MEPETTASQATSILEEIAISLGWPPLAVEICFIIFTMVIILVIFIVVFAILRIRKELISLNFKLGYIARMVKREIEGSEVKRTTEVAQKPPEVDSFKEEWKF